MFCGLPYILRYISVERYVTVSIMSVIYMIVEPFITMLISSQDVLPPERAGFISKPEMTETLVEILCFYFSIVIREKP